MDLRSSALRTLRAAMLERGTRDSMTPPAGTDRAHGSTPGAARRSIATHELGPSDREAILSRVAPICEVLYLLMAADDHVDGREYITLRGTIRALTDGALGTSALNGLLARFESQLEREGRPTRLSKVAAELSADRADAEAAYMLAAAVAIADENTDLRESELLDELGDLLGISPKRRRQLITAENQ
jgi:tellurite resistance protein